MLEQNDLEAIAKIIDSRIGQSENLILKELDRVQEHSETLIEQVKKNLEELQQYYRITRLENENSALLLKIIEGLQKDVEDLKKKTA